MGGGGVDCAFVKDSLTALVSLNPNPIGWITLTYLQSSTSGFRV